VTAQTSSSRGVGAAGIVVGVIVIVVLAAGFLVYIPATSASYLPIAVVSTTESTFVTSSITLVTVTQASTATKPTFDGNNTQLRPGIYDAYSASLTVGTDVQVSYSASESANVYVFNSAEFSAYKSGGTTSPNIATDTTSSGTLDFHISGTDTYWLVIYNPHSGPFGIGSSNVGYTASGSETYPTSDTTSLTQTVTYTTSTPIVTTSTSTSTTTVSCSHNLFSWLSGSKTCP